MKNKRSDNFDKFANKKKGSAVKEEYRQEKKKAKADSRAAGEAARQRKKENYRYLGRKKDIAKGIAVEPVGNNKKGGFAKKDYVTGPPKYTIPLRAKSAPRKAVDDTPAKYGEIKRGAGVGSLALASTVHRRRI